jgi:hypothetical protein
MKNYCRWCQQGSGHPYPALSDHTVSISSSNFACPDCGREIVLIDVTTACKLVRKSRKTIYKWIHTGRVRTMPTHDGRHLICYTSLFRPPGKEEDESRTAAAKKLI